MFESGREMSFTHATALRRAIRLVFLQTLKWALFKQLLILIVRVLLSVFVFSSTKSR